MMVADALNRAGVIMERARREGRSLNRIERYIVVSARDLAAEKKITRHQLNSFEMAGERDWEKVLAPIKVVATFSYFDDPFEEIPAQAHYLVRASNHPGLVEGSHVCAEQLTEAGIKVPKTPTYERWVQAGRKVLR